jgi:hypothetical protein
MLHHLATRLAGNTVHQIPGVTAGDVVPEH